MSQDTADLAWETFDAALATAKAANDALDVARTLARFIPGVTLPRGHEIANVIHSSGRAIVYTGMQEPAEHYWEQLKSAGLTMAPLEQA